MNERRTRTAIVAYGTMAAVAWVWAAATGRSVWNHPEPWLALSPLTGLALSLLVGAALAVGLVRASRELVRRAAWARDLHAGFRDVLGKTSSLEVVVFAGASGLAEELFFRGALQPAIGLVLATLVFGLVHVGPDRRFAPWIALALAVGALFGVLFAATGHLAGCILAHAWVNYANLHFIRTHDPSGPPRAAIRAPSLIGDRTRATGTRSSGG